MKFKLEIDCDNAAFGDDMYNTCVEVESILRTLSDKLAFKAQAEDILRDVNGNIVGKYWFEGERDDENS